MNEDFGIIILLHNKTDIFQVNSFHVVVITLLGSFEDFTHEKIILKKQN